MAAEWVGLFAQGVPPSPFYARVRHARVRLKDQVRIARKMFACDSFLANSSLKVQAPFCVTVSDYIEV